MSNVPNESTVVDRARLTQRSAHRARAGGPRARTRGGTRARANARRARAEQSPNIIGKAARTDHRTDDGTHRALQGDPMTALASYASDPAPSRATITLGPATVPSRDTSIDLGASSGTTELRLLARWCGGSAAAAGELLRRCLPWLRRFFANKVGDATDDLVQQSLMSVVRNREKILDSGAFRTYLFKIARCRLYDYLRAQRRRDGLLDDDFEQDSISPPTVTTTTLIGNDRAASEVRDALRRLPVDMQIVVELHYWEEHSTAEIAAMLDVPQGTVKSRLRRARDMLSFALRSGADEVLELLGRARPEIDEPCAELL